jgi:hypothetical protein
VALLLAAASARGDDAASRPRALEDDVRGSQWTRPSATSAAWYGWQVLLADAGVVAVSFAAVGAKGPGLLFAAGAAYYAGGPIIRTVHNDGGGWSVLRRVTFPLDGVLAGAAIGTAFDHHQDCAEGCASL